MKIRDIIPSNLIKDQYANEIFTRQKYSIIKNFNDPNFKHTYESLINKDFTLMPYNGELDNYDIIWYRATEIFPNNNYDVFRGITPTDIIQGHLGNCYLMSAIACIAEYPELVKRIFDIEQANLYGIYSLWLNINGLWQQIILDDYFPCIVDKHNNKQFLGSSNNDNELWVLLIEKAYAKIHGSYWAISQGNPINILRDLTGSPYHTIEIKQNDQSNSLQIWNDIFKAKQQNYIIAAGTKTFQQHEQIGLKQKHAYSILDVKEIIDSQNNQQRIIKIRNPYGNFEWKGDFSDDDYLWTDKLKKELQIEIKDDGIFWMKLYDFLQYFDYIGILEIDIESTFQSTKFVQNKYNQNLLKLEIYNDDNYTFSIDQITQRYQHNINYQYSYFRMSLFKYQNDTFQYINTVSSCQQSFFMKQELKQGQYFMMIQTQWSNDIVNEYTFGYYSRSLIQIREEFLDQQLFDKINYHIWKNCIINKNFQYDENQDQIPIRSKLGNTYINIKEFKLQNIHFYVFDNSSNNQICFLELKYKDSNQTIVCQKKNQQSIQIYIDKQSIDFIACFDKPSIEVETEFEFSIIQRKFISNKCLQDNNDAILFFNLMNEMQKTTISFGKNQQNFDLKRLIIEFKEKQLRSLINNDQQIQDKLQRKLSSTVKNSYEKLNKKQQKNILTKKKEYNKKPFKKNQFMNNYQQKQKFQFNTINNNKRQFENKINYQFTQQKQIHQYQQNQYNFQQRPITQNFINNLNIVKQESYSQQQDKKQNQLFENKNQISYQQFMNKSRFVKQPYKYQQSKEKVQFEYQQPIKHQDNYFQVNSFQHAQKYNQQFDEYNSFMSNNDSYMSNQSNLRNSQIYFNTRNSIRSKNSFDFGALSSKSTLKKKKLAPFLIKKKQLDHYVNRNGSFQNNKFIN